MNNEIYFTSRFTSVKYYPNRNERLGRWLVRFAARIMGDKFASIKDDYDPPSRFYSPAFAFSYFFQNGVMWHDEPKPFYSRESLQDQLT